MDTGDRTCLAEVVPLREDIAESVEFYTDTLGFRVERISPAGDCVFQPPEVRHRVLETGDSLEVIEVTTPAEHDTFGDHIAADADWYPWTTNGFSYRDLEISSATNHTASALVIRNDQVDGQLALGIIDASFLAVLLGGGAVLNCEQTRNVIAGDAFSITGPSDARLERCTDQFEVLVVRLPEPPQVSETT